MEYTKSKIEQASGIHPDACFFILLYERRPLALEEAIASFAISR